MTGGGLAQGIPRPGGTLWQSKIGYYYLTLVLALTVSRRAGRPHRSPIGLSLMAIRDNETKALAMGLSPIRYKIFAFVLRGRGGGRRRQRVRALRRVRPPRLLQLLRVGRSVPRRHARRAGTIAGRSSACSVLRCSRSAARVRAVRLLLFGILLVALIVFLPQGALRPLVSYARARSFPRRG